MKQKKVNHDADSYFLTEHQNKKRKEKEDIYQRQLAAEKDRRSLIASDTDKEK